MDILKILLTSAVSWIVLFVITRLQGSKQISQLTFFDYISGITIGSVAAELATDLETPQLTLTALIAWGVLTLLSNILAKKSLFMRRIISGEPTVLLQSGRLVRENFRKAGLDVNSFLARCRVMGYFDLSSIELAVLENSGQLSVLPKESERPTVLSDIHKPDKTAQAPIGVIYDGHIIEHNLTLLGRDRRWLDGELHAQGVKSEDVFLATCDSSGKLIAFENKEKPTNSFFTV